MYFGDREWFGCEYQITLSTRNINTEWQNSHVNKEAKQLSKYRFWKMLV